MVDVTQAKIKEILKKLSYNKYYEHAPFITHRITGVPNPHLSIELEEKLREMFKEIQVPFLKHAPANRKNFLSYSYVLNKLLQLLGEDKYLKHFHLLKSREKLASQEQIFKKIAKELGWEFIPSI
jgi:AraC-like DNA-binding protein